MFERLARLKERLGRWLAADAIRVLEDRIEVLEETIHYAAKDFRETVSEKVEMLDTIDAQRREIGLLKAALASRGEAFAGLVKAKDAVIRENEELRERVADAETRLRLLDVRVTTQTVGPAMPVMVASWSGLKEGR